MNVQSRCGKRICMTRIMMRTMKRRIVIMHKILMAKRGITSLTLKDENKDEGGLIKRRKFVTKTEI